MQQTKGSYRYINYIFSFSLVIVFAVLMAILIYSGANSYKSVKEHTDMTFNASTALGYVVNKIHGNDIAGVTIGEENDVEYISLSYGTNEYVMYVYCYEGKLYECIAKASNGFVVGMGEVICQVDDMQIELKNDRLLKITMKDKEDRHKAYVCVNSGVNASESQENSDIES